MQRKGLNMGAVGYVIIIVVEMTIHMIIGLLRLKK